MGLSDFAIFDLEVGAGRIGLSPMPGRSGSYESDLSTVLHWGPHLVLTMTTQPELDRMGATGFGADLLAVGIAWCHLPIKDFGAPDASVRREWVAVAAQATQILKTGGRILVHCFGGCGRSGMVMLRLMVEAGEKPDAALDRLRQVRPCAVETKAQLLWATSDV